MAKADGDSFIDGDILSFQEMNRILTDFWQATKPTNLQSGCLFGQSTTEKLFLQGSSAEEEVLQLTRSKDQAPSFSGMNILAHNETVVVHEGEVVFYNAI